MPIKTSCREKEGFWVAVFETAVYWHPFCQCAESPFKQVWFGSVPEIWEMDPKYFFIAVRNNESK